MELNEKAPAGWKGTVRAMIKHHPEKFDADASGEGKKLNPYAIANAMKKKGDEPHYKDQKSSKKGEPKKKGKFKDEDKKDEKDDKGKKDKPDFFKKDKDEKKESLSLWQQWKLMREARENETQQPEETQNSDA